MKRITYPADLERSLIELFRGVEMTTDHVRQRLIPPISNLEPTAKAAGITCLWLQFQILFMMCSSCLGKALIEAGLIHMVLDEAHKLHHEANVRKQARTKVTKITNVIKAYGAPFEIWKCT